MSVSLDKALLDVKVCSFRSQSPFYYVELYFLMIKAARMNRHPCERSWPKRHKCLWVSIAFVSLLLNLSVAGAADRLVLLSPHWEGIKNEFERAFKEQYLLETGRNVDLEWIDAGGTSEALRFLRSEFRNKPEGVDIDIFFGGGLEP